MLFPQKINTSAKGPKWAGMRQQTWDKSMDEFVCYYRELFTVSRWTPYVSCTSWKNYQAETDALNKNVVQYRGREEKLVSVNILREWNVSQISISTNVVSTKWHHLGINAIFLQQNCQDSFERCIDNVSFRAIWGLGS